MLEVEAVRQVGAFRLDARFAAPTSGVVALFGASGAGKTSLVNALAGLMRPDSGRIVVNGQTLFDSAAGIDLPPERRRLGYVFQDARLFPHIDVAANLLYGFRRAPREARPIALGTVVELLGIQHLLRRRPAALSGGEKQRVAIGRALLANPRLLLLDEPLASLDAARKDEILPFIEELRDRLGLPIVYVTHDMGEIVRLADTVVLLESGRVAAVGPLEDILGRLDLRAITGRAEAGAVLTVRVGGHEPEFALTRLDFAGGSLRVAALDLPVGAQLRVRVRARDVALALAPPREVSVLNILSGTILEIASGEGAEADVRIDVGAPLWARITRRSLHDLGLAVGQPVHAMIKAVAIDRHSLARRPPASGRWNVGSKTLTRH